MAWELLNIFPYMKRTLNLLLALLALPLTWQTVG